MMDAEKIITACTDQNNTVNSVMLGMRDDDEDSLLQLKQDIARDFVSLLLCVAKFSISSTAATKSCAKICDNILENIVDMVSCYITRLTEDTVVNY
jgi:hypothetical protein